MKRFSVHLYPMLGTLLVPVQLKMKTEDDDAGEPLPVVMYHQAHAAYLQICSYLLPSHEMGESESESPCLLNELEKEIEKCNSKNCAQSLITDYFYSSRDKHYSFMCIFVLQVYDLSNYMKKEILYHT